MARMRNDNGKTRAVWLQATYRTSAWSTRDIWQQPPSGPSECRWNWTSTC